MNGQADAEKHAEELLRHLFSSREMEMASPGSELNRMARVEFEQKRYGPAIRCCEQAVQVAGKLQQPYPKGAAYVILAAVRLCRRAEADLEKAQADIRRAAEVFDHATKRYELALALLGRGWVRIDTWKIKANSAESAAFTRESDFSDALRWYQEAFQILCELKSDLAVRAKESIREVVCILGGCLDAPGARSDDLPVGPDVAGPRLPGPTGLEIAPGRPNAIPERPAAPGSRPATRRATPRGAELFLFPVTGSIAAGRPIATGDRPGVYATVGTLIIGGEEYLIEPIGRSRSGVLRLDLCGKDWYIAPVRGDSMNAFSPPINDSDYVLLRSQPAANDYEVVAVVMSQVDQQQATLKQYVPIGGGRHVLRPCSHSDEHQEFDHTEETQIVAVAEAVLCRVQPEG